MIQIPDFDTKKELFDYLKANKQLILLGKKSAMKKADSFIYQPTPEYFDTSVKKEIGLVSEDIASRSLKVKVVINATNMLDSHNDVHLPGIWKKSLQQNKFPLHLQEHEMDFDKVIADGEDVKVYTQRVTWKSLGYDYPGSTEVLKHESVILGERNPFMFNQYLKGWVRNHSVGMQYVNMLFCVNSEEKYWAEEKDNWEKYLPEIVNQQDAIDKGFFWAIAEAKYIEGSAVVKGSCPATPTQEVTEITGAADSTPKNIAPGNSTQTKSIFSNLKLVK